MGVCPFRFEIKIQKKPYINYHFPGRMSRGKIGGSYEKNYSGISVTEKT